MPIVSRSVAQSGGSNRADCEADHKNLHWRGETDGNNEEKLNSVASTPLANDHSPMEEVNRDNNNIAESIEDIVENKGISTLSATMEYPVQFPPQSNFAENDAIDTNYNKEKLSIAVCNNIKSDNSLRNVRRTNRLDSTRSVNMSKTAVSHGALEHISAEEFVRHYTKLVVAALRQQNSR